MLTIISVSTRPLVVNSGRSANRIPTCNPHPTLEIYSPGIFIRAFQAVK
jgi:hypothetical protein